MQQPQLPGLLMTQQLCHMAAPRVHWSLNSYMRTGQDRAFLGGSFPLQKRHIGPASGRASLADTRQSTMNPSNCRGLSSPSPGGAAAAVTPCMLMHQGWGGRVERSQENCCQAEVMKPSQMNGGKLTTILPVRGLAEQLLVVAAAFSCTARLWCGWWLLWSCRCPGLGRGQNQISSGPQQGTQLPPSLQTDRPRISLARH